MTKRLAILADIHGNLPALEAVLDDIAGQGVDEVVLAGDLVGRGPQGSAVSSRVRELGLESVRGNHEDYLLDFRKGAVPEEWMSAEEWACTRWMADELSNTDIEFLDALPFSMTRGHANEVRIVHGSSRSYNEGIGPWLHEAEIQEHFDSVEEPVLICAHTHRAHVWRLPQGLVVNVGSVGLPFNRDTRAQYALLERNADSWDVELKQVQYDLNQTRRAFEETGFLDCGGATAALLLKELESATPYLVPFLKWAEVLERPPLLDGVPEFLDFHRPDLPLAEQFARFNALQK